VSGIDGMEMGEYTYRVERKVAVIDAAAAWAEAIREHGVDAALPFRQNFAMALDDALTAGEAELERLSAENQELRAALERYRERMP
jgi:phosphosulfolactate phosphohydrolase-like enzyme